MEKQQAQNELIIKEKGKTLDEFKGFIYQQRKFIIDSDNEDSGLEYDEVNINDYDECNAGRLEMLEELAKFIKMLEKMNY